MYNHFINIRDLKVIKCHFGPVVHCSSPGVQQRFLFGGASSEGVSPTEFGHLATQGGKLLWQEKEYDKSAVVLYKHNLVL